MKCSSGLLLVLSAIMLCPPVRAAHEENWTEVKSPHFTVLSDASTKQARETARSLEQFRLLLRTVLPKLKADPGTPLIVFAMRDAKGFRTLIPAERQGKNAAEPVGIFLKGPERNFIALRLDVPGDQAYHVPYHEYVHQILALNIPGLPLWLNEGLAELLAFARIAAEESSLGDSSPDLVRALRDSSMMPLHTLLTARQDSPYYKESAKARVFYAQSWALTHYLLLGDMGAHSGKLAEFLNMIENGRSEEEAIARLGDLNALQDNVRKYVNVGSFFHIPVRLGNTKEEEYPVRSLSDPESLAFRGQILVASNRLEDAKETLEKALAQDSRCAAANEGMGLLFWKKGEQEPAENYFTAAAELDSKSYIAQYFAGRSEFQRGRDLNVAETYVRKALAVNPQFAPGYSVLALILSAQENRFPEALDMAIKAANLEPSDVRHYFNVCEIMLRTGKFDEASEWAERARSLAASDPDRTAAETMLSQIRNRRETTHKEKTEAEELQQQARQEEQRRLETARLRLSVKKGPVEKLIGVVKSVTCEPPAVMDLVIESGGVKKKFRAENYYKTEYEAIGGEGKTDFDPCEELKGTTIQIEYQGVVSQEFSGLLLKCGIVK
jgi:tetratricopeptide (TPR) repeat protein